MDGFTAAQRPTDEELRLFLARIGQRLEERPVDLDPEVHRERVAALLRQAGEASFYDLLDLPPTAGAQEVHEAYERIARLVHPVQARRLGLGGREGVLEMLFERLTLAYLTLFQPDRRKIYDRDLDPGAWSASLSPGAGRRREEARSVAQGYYERALELVAADDYHFAIELLQQAVRADDGRAEYFALLGKLQARNSRWLRVAAENLQRAVHLGSRDPELKASLARVKERLAAGEALLPPTTDVKPKGRDVPDIEVVDEEEINVPWSQADKRTRW